MEAPIHSLTQAGWNAKVGTGSFIVFVRLREFYNTFTVLAALIAALSAGILTFDEVCLDELPCSHREF